MNDAETPKDQASEQSQDQPCAPCHGSGQVISTLGGQQRKVTCPWCQGGGVRLAGADAQRWRVEPDQGAAPGQTSRP